MSSTPPPLTTAAQRARGRLSPLDCSLCAPLRARLLEATTACAPLEVSAIGGSASLGSRRVRPFPLLFGDALGRLARCEPRVTVTNHAVGGAGANYFASCANRHVQRSTGIVLVELNANYGSVAAFERVLRKLLLRRPRPVPIVVQLG
eukprot:6894062-Prymnesium_polylepis.1